MKRELGWFHPLVQLHDGFPSSVLRGAEALQGMPGLAECVGDELRDALVERVHRDGAFRRECVQEMRKAVWHVRNHRVVSAETVAEMTLRTLHFGELFLAAGVSPELLGRLTSCLLDGCVCAGCDLWDGDRFAALASC